MKSLSALLENNEKVLKELSKHPRHKLLDVIYQKVNSERKAQDMKPLAIRVFGIKTSHLSLTDLDYLVKICSQKSNFSRMFFGLLKVKK